MSGAQGNPSGGSTNPFDLPPQSSSSQQQSNNNNKAPAPSSTSSRGSNSRSVHHPHHHHHHHNQHHNHHPAEPAIWAARNVDWPIPSSLSQHNYQKLLQQSQALGQDYGIAYQAHHIPATSRHHAGGNTAVDAPGATGGDTIGGAGTGQDHTASSSSAYGLTGFMSRVLSTSSAGAGDTDDGGLGKKGAGGGSAGGVASSSSANNGNMNNSNNNNNNKSSLASSSSPLRPPRAHCVAAANGWIVAVLETTAPGLPSLRLISRWNVRRGSLSGSSLSDHWMALPPPLLFMPPNAANNANNSSSNNPNSNNNNNLKMPTIKSEGRIKHVLVDPTASHTLVSANNGEAYYLHSSGTQRLVKLPGFGPSAPIYNDSTTSSSGKKKLSTTTPTAGADATASMTAGLHLTGIPATAVAHRRDEQAQASIQAGLTLGSYVTAVAWDRERGTEVSSKRVLLGTSLGEIYEYTFPNPDHDEKMSDIKGGKEGLHNLPILLHKLSDNGSGSSMDESNMDPSQVGAAVTGLYFERLRTGMVVICATSGRNKRTRFHSFYSPHNSSFSTVLADQQYASLMELPGSVDFANMVMVNDVFALRTAVGIYYGRIDRSLTNAASTVAAGGSSMIVDAGLLAYDAIAAKTTTSDDGMSTSSGNSGNNAVITPVSLALTPHHFIMLTENNQVCFINRVAQKIIQKERVDQQGGSSSMDETTVSLGALLMDIRRPDQVWLRQGRHLVHISSSQEDRDVWKYTLQKCLDMKPMHASKTSSSSGGISKAKPTSFDAFINKPLTEEEKAQEALFEQAKAQCSNAAQKAVVTAVRAEYHLSQGRAELAAKYFAMCPSVLEPFSDTSIRLALPKLGVDDPRSYGGSAKARDSLAATNVPLITYLADKMRVGKMNDDRMTCTMIGAWLTELYLHERGERRASAPLIEPSLSPSAAAAATDDSALLAQFLNNNVNNMDAKTIMKILTSHDVGAHECALYAAKSGDIATAVNAALSVGAHDTNGAYEALGILGESPFELAEPLYYRHASILLSRAPGGAVDGFLARYAEGLSPSRLLPSIMNYEQRRAAQVRERKLAGAGEEKTPLSSDERKESLDGMELRLNRTMILTTSSFVEDEKAAIRYLEGVINQGCRVSAVFSYLISLYAKLTDEEPLLKFLTVHVPGTSAWNNAASKSTATRNESYALSGPLDMSAALRTVLASGRHYRSAIKLYMGFGMRQQAVELALKVDPSLARELAQESVELEERKRLWLMIAKNAASDSSSRGGKDVVSRVVSVLKDCGPDVLSIEDVLPFLPDFAQIDQIKDEICEALTSYSSRIEGFLREMSECDHTCDNLRSEIARLKSRQVRVKTNARCAITNKLVLKDGEPFYVFPSGYVILASALKKEVMPYLNEKQRSRVLELEKELSVTPESEPSREKLQTELDGLIAAECPLTGTVMIESIDRGFDNSDEMGNLDFGPLDIERAEV